MAALAAVPLLMGLPNIISGITRLFTGKGGKSRKRVGKALSVMNKWPLLSRTKRFMMGGRSGGFNVKPGQIDWKTLPLLNEKWPVITSGPHTYRQPPVDMSSVPFGKEVVLPDVPWSTEQVLTWNNPPGGAGRKRVGKALSIMNKWPLLSRTKRYMMGGRSRAKGGFNPAAMLRQEMFKAIDRSRGRGGLSRAIEASLPLVPLKRRPSPVPGLKRGGAVLSRGSDDSDKAYLARKFAYKHGGLHPTVGKILSGITKGADIIGQVGKMFGFGQKGLKRASAPKARAPRVRSKKGGFNFLPILSGITQGANVVGQIGKLLGFGGKLKVLPAAHRVKGHVSQSKYGKPFYVKQHLAAGTGASAKRRGGRTIPFNPMLAPALAGLPVNQGLVQKALQYIEPVRQMIRNIPHIGPIAARLGVGGRSRASKSKALVVRKKGGLFNPAGYGMLF